MPNEPISQLTQTFSPSGTDVVPIVSGGITQKVSLNTLTNSVSANVYGYPFIYGSGQTLDTPGVINYLAATQNQLIVYPIVLSQPVSISAISCYVSTLAASSTINLGIYTSTAFGNMPNTLIAATTGTVPGSATGQQIYTYTTNVALSADIYWLALVAQGGTPSLQVHYNVATFNLPQASLSTAINVGYQITGVTGALPSTFTGNTPITIANRVWLKLV